MNATHMLLLSADLADKDVKHMTERLAKAVAPRFEKEYKINRNCLMNDGLLCMIGTVFYYRYL